VSRLRRRLDGLPGRSSARLGGYSLVAQVAGLVAGTANFLLLARSLGPADYGVIAGAWALILATAPIAMLGAEALVTRDVAGLGRRPAQALGAGLATVGLGSSVGLLLLVGLHPFLLPQVPIELIVGLAVADIFCLGATGCLAALLFAIDSARAVAVVAVVNSGAKLGAVVVFALLGGNDPVQWAALYAAFSVAAALLQFGWAARRYGRPVLGGHGLLGRARTGLSYSVNSAGIILMTDSDKTLLVRNGFSTEAGVYGVAYRLSTMAALPVTAVLHATFPRFFSIGETGGLRATTAFARKLAVPLAAYGVFAGVALLVVAPLVPLVVGEEYRPSVPLLMVLAGLPLLRTLESLPSDALTGAGRQSTRTACVMAAAAVNVVLNLLLIPHHGVKAAVATTLLSEVLFLALVTLAVRKGLDQGDEPVVPAVEALGQPTAAP
jgi:O-antigen/teichoic acid export membrane protein